MSQDTNGTEQARLNRLYPSMAKTTAPTHGSDPATASDATGTTFEDVAERFFGGDDSIRRQYGGAMKDSFNRLQDAVDLTDTDRATLELETARFFEHSSFTVGEAAQLHSKLVASITHPKDDAAREADLVQSRKLMREKYGRDGAAERYDQVDEWLGDHPAVKKQLEKSGFINSPDLVLPLAAAVHKLRRRKA